MVDLWYMWHPSITLETNHILWCCMRVSLPGWLYLASQFDIWPQILQKFLSTSHYLLHFYQLSLYSIHSWMEHRNTLPPWTLNEASSISFAQCVGRRRLEFEISFNKKLIKYCECVVQHEIFLIHVWKVAPYIQTLLTSYLCFTFSLQASIKYDSEI